MPSRLFLATVCAVILGAADMQAQSSNQLKWEVISVKPTAPDSCRDGNGGVRFFPNGLSANCASTLFIVEYSYHLMDPTRILGLPKWATGPQTYSIDARVSGQDAAAFDKLKREEKARMMQTVFAERFGMKAHMETRELPAYALVLAKSGPKLKESSATTRVMSQFGGSTGEVKWANAPLTDLKFLLAQETGRPVVDQTGLTGKYDFILQYTPAGQAATDQSGKPSIFTALEEQLGLRLVSTKQPVEVLVIDSMEQPTEN